MCSSSRAIPSQNKGSNPGARLQYTGRGPVGAIFSAGGPEACKA
jgi:hypothetical protein